MSNISVVIPTYNRAHRIGAAIKSVLGQTRVFHELIIVDDGSSDQTEEVVKSFGDRRILFYRMSENRGAAAARNKGVELASSELIAFLDSDDTWLPEKLEKQVEYREMHRDFSMIYSRFYYREDSEDGYSPFSDIGNRKMEGNIYLELLERNVIGTPTVLVDKACFLKCGGFDASLRCLEDWEFAVRFAKHYLIGFVDESLTECYLERATSVSANYEEHFRVRFRMLKDHREALEQNGMLERLIVGLFSAAQDVGLEAFAKTCFRETFFPGL